MFVGELICLFVFRLTVVKDFFVSMYRKRQGTNNVSAETYGETQSLMKDGSDDTIVNNVDSGVSMDDIVADGQQQQQQQQTKKYINPLIFWIPAICDLGGTTLLNVGLFYTAASVYQMLRGTLVVFNGIFSVIFLKHRLYPHHWGGILLITIGTSIVGLSSYLYQNPDSPTQPKNPLLGNILEIGRAHV